MKNDFFQPTIKLTWKCKIYNCSKKANRTISERVSALSDIQEGSIFETITELDYIRRIIESRKEKDKKPWNSVFNAYFSDSVVKAFEGNENAINSEGYKNFFASIAFGWMAFQIRKNVINFLITSENSILQNEQYLSNFQSKIDDECAALSSMFLSYLSTNPTSRSRLNYKKFWEALEKRVGSEPKDAIKEYKKHHYRKCVSCFLPNDSITLVAISGYQDCTDDEMYHTLKGPENVRDYHEMDIYKNICVSMGANLITTNNKICYFGDNPSGGSKDLQIVEELGEAIVDIKKGKQKRNDVCDRYSCCERKIFSQWCYNIDSDATLFVTAKPCSRCELAINYYKNKFGKFEIIDPRSV